MMVEKSTKISPEEIQGVKYTSCNICSSVKKEILFSNKNIGGKRFDYVRCKKCGLIYVYPMIEMNTELTKQLYDDKLLSDFQRHMLSKDFFSSECKVLKMSLKRQLQEISKYKRTGRLLDVGCGYGWFLKTAQNESWEVTGIDISATMCNYVRDKLNLNVLQTELYQAYFPPSNFDVLRLNDIVEHIQNPKSLLQESNRILKLGGLLVVRFPNPKPLIAYLRYLIDKFNGKKTSWVGNLDPPYHLYDFSLNTMELLLKKTGFKKLRHHNIIADDPIYSADDPEIDLVSVNNTQKRRATIKSELKPVALKFLRNIARIFNYPDAFVIFAQKYKSL